MTQNINQILSRTKDRLARHKALVLVFLIIAVSSILTWRDNSTHTDYSISKNYFGQYRYENTNKDFKVSFLDKKDQSKPWVEFASKGSGIQMALETNSDTLNKAKIENKGILAKKSKLTIPNISNNTDLTYEIIDKGVKEDIVLNNKNALGKNRPEYRFTVKLRNVYPLLSAKGYFSGVFLDKTTHKYAFHFLKPVMVDAKGVKSDEIAIRIEEVKISNIQYPISNKNPNDKKLGKENSDFGFRHFIRNWKLEIGNLTQEANAQDNEKEYTIILKPSQKWLTDPSRSFPIRIDPFGRP